MNEEVEVVPAYSDVTVRLLIFSGRPDPVWALPDEHINGVASALAEFAQLEAGGPPDVPNYLGYQGFHVWNPSGEFGIPREFTVAEGVITIIDRESGEPEPRQTFMEDTDRKVEQALLRATLQKAEDEGYEDIFEEGRAILDGSG